MLIRRRIVSALCLLSVGSSVVVGQQKNPFAEWDRISKQTETTINESSVSGGQVGRAKSSRPNGVQYFAPTGSAPEIASRQEATSKGQASPVRNQPEPLNAQSGSEAVMVERLKSQRQVQESAFESLVENSPSGPVAARSSSTSALSGDSSVEQAGYEGTSESGIVQTSGVTEKRQQQGTNPFAEMLSQPPRVQPASAVEPPLFDFGEDEETAAPLGSTPQGGPARAFAETAESGTSFMATGAQSPGVTLQWIRHGQFNVGQECDVELQVQNTSRVAVRGVMLETVIPNGLDVVAVTPQPSSVAPGPTWTFGEMAANEKRSVTFRVVPTHRGDVHMEGFVRLTGYSSSTFSVQEPMIAVALEGPADIKVGQQVKYTVRVTNPGTGTASNVRIQTAIPEGLEHRRGSLLTIEIGTLSPGESREADLMMTAIRGGSHDVAVRVVADGGLLDQTVASVKIAEPQLALKIHGPGEQMAGRTGEYTLQVGNDGSVPSANVRAKYRVPEGYEFVSADRGGKFNETDRSIEWFVGTVGAGGSSQFKVVLRATQTGEALHQAGVISELGRATLAEHTTRVDGTAVLELAVNANRTQGAVNEEITYEVRIGNSGAREAKNVGFSCEIPSSLEIVNVAGPSEYIAENGVMVFKSMPEIDAGKEAVFALKLRCKREGNHRIRLRIASESVSEAVIGEETITVTQ
ncbi:MAG: DUF11 domain-containing protein [Planctomycetaceae bacterium]|nr:DUF11 domain-containing protein [Planctomycetaceae bacterium]